MDCSFSGKGKVWEWKHSIWILWTLPLFGWISFISFLYIGRRTKTTKLTVFGFIYLAWTIIQLIILPLFPSDSLIGSFLVPSYTIGLVIWIWSIIHAFLVRKEYLTRLSYLLDYPEIGEKTRNKYYNAVTSDYQKSVQNNTIRKVISMSKNETDKTDYRSGESQLENNHQTDINICNRDKLIMLPGITLPIAQKIIDRRNAEGDFTSVDEFLDFVMVKPHFAVQLREVITVSTDADEKLKKQYKRNMDF